MESFLYCGLKKQKQNLKHKTNIAEGLERTEQDLTVLQNFIENTDRRIKSFSQVMQGINFLISKSYSYLAIKSGYSFSNKKES